MSLLLLFLMLFIPTAFIGMLIVYGFDLATRPTPSNRRLRSPESDSSNPSDERE